MPHFKILFFDIMYFFLLHSLNTLQLIVTLIKNLYFIYVIIQNPLKTYTNLQIDTMYR